MKYFFVFIACSLTTLCFCQTKNFNFLESYISTQKKFEFTKCEFLKEKMLKLTSDTFTIIKCTVYLSDWGNKTANIQPITTTSIFNNLKDSTFISLFNQRQFPTSITFDDIIVENKARTILLKIEGIAIKVNP